MATPASWTSDNMSWPSSVSSPDGRPLMPYLDACRAAAAERCEALTGSTGWFGSQIGDTMPSTEWAARWADEIDALCGRGRLTNGATGFGWVEKDTTYGGTASSPDILTANDIVTRIIGDNRLQAAASTPMSWEWIYQQYSILRQLVWLMNRNPLQDFFTDPADNSDGDGVSFGPGTTLALAKASAESNYGTAAGFDARTILSAFRNIVYLPPIGWNYNAQIRNYSGKVESVDASTHAREVDYYFFVRATTGPAHTNEWDAQGNTDYSGGVWAENTYVHIDRATAATGTSYSAYQGDTQATTWSTFVPVIATEMASRGWEAVQPFAIAKHNVTSGFSFN